MVFSTLQLPKGRQPNIICLPINTYGLAKGTKSGSDQISDPGANFHKIHGMKDPDKLIVSLQFVKPRLCEAVNNYK